MCNIRYSTDGNGNWWRTQWDDQCSEKLLFGNRCQGTKGHKGVHWCYGLDGSFEWSDNDSDPPPLCCAGITPPGHKAWISPVDQIEKHHMNFRQESKVTDPKVVSKLENEEELEEGASYTRPVVLKDLKNIEKIRLEERLKD